MQSVPIVILFSLILATMLTTRAFVHRTVSEVLGEITADAKNLLEEIGADVIMNKAADTADKIDLYFRMHPDIPVTEMRNDPAFIALALQKVGDSGYTLLAEADSYLFRVHPSTELNDTDMRILEDRVPSWTAIIDGISRGEAFSGYYDWLEPDDTVRKKFAAVVPVQTLHQGAHFVVFATTYLEEFSRPAGLLEERTEAIQASFSTFFYSRWLMIILISLSGLLLSIAMIFLMMRRTRRLYIAPIIHMADAARTMGDGNMDALDNDCFLDQDDEIGLLCATLKAMAGKIRASIAVIEKSEERHRMISDFSSDYVYVIHFNPGDIPVIEWISGAFQEITGYTPEEINSLPQGFLSIAHHEDKKRLIEMTVHGPKDEKVRGFEYRIIRKDGELRWVIDRLKLIFDGSGNISTVMGSSRDITERKIAEKNIEKSLNEKESLLRELYHRTKNNLQLINSMINLQAETIEDDLLRKRMKEIESRILTIALVHQKLYESKNLSRINLKEYVTDLVNEVMYIDGQGIKAIERDLSLENVYVLIDTAIPFGLLLDEILLNIFKHGFNGMTGGKISLVLRQDHRGVITMVIADNGNGFPPGFDPRTAATLGMQTIFSIAEDQLEGHIQYSSGHGVTWTLRFSDDRYISRI